MLKNVGFLLALLLVLVLFCAIPRAFAQGVQAPVELGKFEGFTAYAQERKTGRACYIVAQPAKTAPASVRRDPVYLFITHRPKEKIRNEISLSMGYPLKPDAPASLEIVPGGIFPLAAQNEGAWLAEAANQTLAVDAMRKAREVVVKGTSKRGTATTDTYALKGLAQALARIDQECK